MLFEIYKIVEILRREHVFHKQDPSKLENYPAAATYLRVTHGPIYE